MWFLFTYYSLNYYVFEIAAFFILALSLTKRLLLPLWLKFGSGAVLIWFALRFLPLVGTGVVFINRSMFLTLHKIFNMHLFTTLFLIQIIIFITGACIGLVYEKIMSKR